MADQTTTTAPSSVVEVKQALAGILDGWPIGEPSQEISRTEADELADFIVQSLARRGITLHATPTAAQEATHV